MITIVHLENSRSERIIWLMEELALPYVLERFERRPDLFAPDDLKEISPMGKAPIIRDGDTVVIESGAIIEYIIHRHAEGRLSVPPASSDYARYLQWMHFAEGSAMSQFMVSLFTSGFVPGVDPNSPLVALTKGRTAHVLAFIEEELGKTTWFAGDAFTAADIMMTYCFGVVRGFLRIDLSQYPNIEAYLARIGERPAYQRAMALANL